MKTVTIQKLRMQNFKGIKDFTLEASGKNISVFGENETGKSTLADGFFYLLFGKDSHDKADFQIKPVATDGQEIHNLETEVEAVLDIDGKTVSLMKRYKEKWTKKRGQAREAFTGHTTDHFVDEVPVKKKDYDKKIGEVININNFKLVTNPFEFSSIPWKARRDILLEICGDVSDQDVIESDDNLTALADILTGATIDDHQAKVKAKQRKINDELKQIPVRISENQEASKDVEKPEQRDKKQLENQIEESREKLRSLTSNEALSAKRVRLNEINSEIVKANTEADQKTREAKEPIQTEIDLIQAELRVNRNKIADLKDQIEQDEKRNEVSKAAIEDVRKRWYDEDSKQPSKDNTCPTCGQDLPEEHVKETTATFNRLKSERLGKINKEGKTLKKAISQRDKDISANKLSIENLEKVIAALEVDVKTKEEQLEKVYVPVDLDAMDKEKDILESEIDALMNGSSIQEKNAQDKINELQGKLDGWNKSQSEWDAAEKARARIIELEAKEKDLAAEYERLESEIFLFEKFIVKKVELLEDQINSRFSMARFKLFDVQINGGVNECCEILYNGVPFDKGLNSAARINTGLDIVNTLSEYYGFSAPVFVDNAESVNSLIPINSQVISLIVSDDKKLTVKENKEVNAA